MFLFNIVNPKFIQTKTKIPLIIDMISNQIQLRKMTILQSFNINNQFVYLFLSSEFTYS